MVFETLAVLFATPVHEKTVREMNFVCSDANQDSHACGPETGQKSQNQADRTDRLSDDGRHSQGVGNFHRFRKHLECGLEAVSAKIVRGFLQAVDEHYPTQRQSKYSEPERVYRLQYFSHAFPAEHPVPWLVRVILATREGLAITDDGAASFMETEFPIEHRFH